MNLFRFPSNTIVWLEAKVCDDAKFFPSLIGLGNYENFKIKYQNELVDCADESDERVTLIRPIWKDLGALADNSPHPQTKDFAINIINYLRQQWKADWDRFNGIRLREAFGDRDEEHKIEMKAVELKDNYLTIKLSDISNMCPICYEPHKSDEILIITNCKHVFHEKCLKPWLEKNNNCPMCRAKIN